MLPVHIQQLVMQIIQFLTMESIMQVVLEMFMQLLLINKVVVVEPIQFMKNMEQVGIPMLLEQPQLQV